MRMKQRDYQKTMPNSKDSDQTKIAINVAFKQAVDHFNAGRYTDSDQICTAIIQTVPNHIDAINLLGVIAQKLGRYDLAIELFQRAINIDNCNPLLYYNLATAFSQLGQINEAIKVLQTALEKEPDNIQIAEYLITIRNSTLANTAVDGTRVKDEEFLQKGLEFHQAGQLDQAAICYQKCLEINNKNAHAFANMGAIFQAKGEMEKAVDNYQKAIKIQPGLADTLYNLGKALQEQGKHGLAISSYQKAIAIKPDFAEAYSNIAVALQEQDRLEDAVGYCQKAIAIQPNIADTYYNLGNILKEQGKLGSAVYNYQKAITIKPGFADAYYNLGNVLKEQEKLDLAADSYQQAITLKPGYAGALYNLGIVLEEQGKLDLAVVNYQKAIAINPGFADAYYNLGKTINELGNLDLAVEYYQKAVAINPEYAKAYYNLGIIFREQGKLDLAITSYRQAIAIKPDYAQAYSNLGNALREQGKLDLAVECYQRAIAIKPDLADAYFNLSTNKKYSDISEIQFMKTALANTTSIDDQIHLNFAIGKAMSDIKHYSEAFQYYLEGNRVKRSTINYDFTSTKKFFNQQQEIFNRALFEARDNFGCIDGSPIFILGMPRSGSTLVEQILSSHPDVYGAGELDFISRYINERVHSNMDDNISDAYSRLNSNDFYELGSKYIKKIREKDKYSKFITDKMPHNFLNIGMIRLILPNAKIVHTVRSPEDTCLSIFRTKFSEVHDYAYNLTELGQYYRLYSEIMAHWHRTLPGLIYDINYEALISNQEDETKKLLDYCSLEWNDNCLQFHKTIRNVKTASNYQVRQPMYSSSVGGWRRFEKELQPLIAALGDLATEAN
ncbi:MAG: tetratricopeptide repeat protein [Magnetococcales bacterium]|nr:tetratricopeptide repeat protein [Magnetococcales bacterium]